MDRTRFYFWFHTLQAKLFAEMFLVSRREKLLRIFLSRFLKQTGRLLFYIDSRDRNHRDILSVAASLLFGLAGVLNHIVLSGFSLAS